MKLKNLVLNSLKNVDLSMIDIKEPSKEFLDLIKKEIILQRKKNYSFPIPKIDKLQIPNFVFLLRTLDFRRWEFKKNWVYKNKKRFWALFSKLEDLFKIGVKNIDYKIFKKIISPKESDSLGKLRFKFFKKNLLWLKNNYDGNFKNYFEKNKNPLNFTLGLTNLGRFEDIAKNSKKIYFLKPNQLLYTEYLLATNQMKKYSENLKDLTAFADYRLPQVLMYFNIIIPNKKLLDKIKNKKIIRIGSKEEIEIRASTILACELIKNKIKKVSSFEVDMALWNFTYKNKIKINIPHFRAKSIFY
ncbi:MAG: queuosine salvage family protein [Patescibacteria group bacterium]